MVPSPLQSSLGGRSLSVIQQIPRQVIAHSRLILGFNVNSITLFDVLQLVSGKCSLFFKISPHFHFIQRVMFVF